jgi:hypothetical protein
MHALLRIRQPSFIAPGDAAMKCNHIVSNESRGEFGAPTPKKPGL